MKIIQPTFIAGVCLWFAATCIGQAPAKSTSAIKFIGTTHLNSRTVTTAHGGLGLVDKGVEVDENKEIPGAGGSSKPARVKAAHVPTPAGNGFTKGSFAGFVGLRELDQAVAFAGPTGANGELEPPDQGLAAGNGFVIEAVNTALTVYDTSGNNLLGGALALSLLFGQPPVFTIDPSTNEVTSDGPKISDPRVLYDASTGHFLVSATEIGIDPTTGNLANPGSGHILIAVSLDANPFDGFNVFSLDVTNDGDAAFGSCPCFGDQPLIGFDANGIYISTNAINVASLTFRGAQIYAISKAAIESAPPSATPVSITAAHFHNLTQAEGPGFSVHPASVPPGGSFATANGGTEYFVSSLDFDNTLDNRLTVWALTNTSLLNSSPDALQPPTNTVINTETYGAAPAADQKPGATPLLDCIFSGGPACAFIIGNGPAFGIKNHEELVSSNDDRQQQVTYAQGRLWTSLATVVQTPHGPARAGAAWFILSPSVDDSGRVSANVFNQGYVAIDSAMQNNILFPSVAVNANGKAVIGFSIVGDNFYPSAGYANLDANKGAGPVTISYNGVAPEDGFTAYRPFGPNFRAARWGDYSRATSDEFGNFWLGTEVIPPKQFPLVLFANWGTFITSVAP